MSHSRSERMVLHKIDARAMEPHQQWLVGILERVLMPIYGQAFRKCHKCLYKGGCIDKSFRLAASFTLDADLGLIRPREKFKLAGSLRIRPRPITVSRSTHSLACNAKELAKKWTNSSLANEVRSYSPPTAVAAWNSCNYSPDSSGMSRMYCPVCRMAWSRVSAQAAVMSTGGALRR
eukprot:2851667-Amphidinium_carterae.1